MNVSTFMQPGLTTMRHVNFISSVCVILPTTSIIAAALGDIVLEDN